MRNPNGYGTVAKLSGNRRKPYIVKKTIGFDDRHYPKYLIIGYAETREEGMMLLAEYNRNPYDIDLAHITLKQLYDRWSKRDYPKMAYQTIKQSKTFFKKLSFFHDTPYRTIKAYQMQDTIDAAGGYSSQGAMKSLWKRLDKFAMELDIIQKPNSALTTSAPIPQTTKIPFTEAEITAVWKHKDIPWMDTVLILLYSGWRIGELLTLRLEDIDLEAGTMLGGSKTRNGKNRIVPIHSKIYDIVKARAEASQTYLIELNGHCCSAASYRIIWKQLMNTLHMIHTPHECRHTFRTRLDSAGANKVCIDLMMGHKSKETGERIYTHKTVKELKLNLELVT